MHYGTTWTGRENRIIYHDRLCGWQSEPKPYPIQEISPNQCPNCGRWGLHFVVYEDGVENEAASRVIAMSP
jgi:hypothetical protein